MQYVKKISPGPIEFFAHIDVVAMALIAAIGILIAFVILAVEIVVTIIEFHIVTLVAFVTVPFGVLTQTSFMSERAIGYVVSVGIKLMALAIVVSLGTTVFDNYTVSSDPGIGEDVGLLLAAVVMVMLALKIPSIAAALISGGPQLNAGGAVMGAAGVAAGVAGGA
jgi:type IV secretion system protein TrbL